MKKQIFVFLVLAMAVWAMAEKDVGTQVENSDPKDESVENQGATGNITPGLIDELKLTPDQKQGLRESYLQNQKKKIQLQSEKAMLELDLKNVLSSDPINKAEAARVGEKIGDAEKRMTQLKVESWTQFLTRLSPDQHRKVLEFQARHREMRMERKEQMRKENRERRQLREEVQERRAGKKRP